jgi:hypothetical protein
MGPARVAAHRGVRVRRYPNRRAWVKLFPAGVSEGSKTDAWGNVPENNNWGVAPATRSDANRLLTLAFDGVSVERAEQPAAGFKEADRRRPGPDDLSLDGEAADHAMIERNNGSPASQLVIV